VDTFELCKAIRKAIVNRAAEVMTYKGWSDEFCAEQIREIPEWVKGSENFRPIHPAELTAEQMKELGFCGWSEESSLMLIPLWLLPFLADEFEGGCIDGETRTFKRDELDNDHRFGCLAYGVIPNH
jgi:hypothetical protein